MSGVRSRLNRIGFKRIVTVVSAASVLPSLGACALGAASQQEVFQSINQSVSEGTDPTRFLAGLVIVVVALVGLVIGVNYARRRGAKPLASNNPAKLLKEMARALNIKPSQMRQLKLVAAEKDLSSPLLLLLCPSLRKTQKGGEAAEG